VNETLPILLLRASAVLSAVFIFAVGCVRNPGGLPKDVSPVAQMSVNGLLVAELRMRSAWGPVDSATVRFRRDSSVIGGARIDWAVYNPPSALHVYYTAVAISPAGREPVLIRTAADWARATIGFIPSDRQQLLDACAEGVHVTDRLRLPSVAPRIYTGSESLENLPLSIGTSNLTAMGVASPRIVHDSVRGWRADFWAIVMKDVTRYDCTFNSPGASLTELQRLPGSGYVPG